MAFVGDVIDPDVAEFEGASLTVDTDPVCAGSVLRSADDDTAWADTSELAILVGNGGGASGQLGIAPRAEVTFIGMGDASLEDDCSDPFAEALRRAEAVGAQIVVFAHQRYEASEADVQAFADALNDGVVIVAPNPNRPRNVGVSTVPAILNGVVSVSGFDVNGQLLAGRDGTPVVFPETTVVAVSDDMTSAQPDDETPYYAGSTFGAAIVAGILAVARQRWPDASSAQLIQSLIHNTTNSGGEAVDDTESGFGYGIASLRGMMGADPAQYPDVNPLLDKASGQPPASRIVPGGTGSPTAPATATDAATTPPADAAGPTGLPTALPWVIGGVAGLAVIGAVVLTLVVVARRGKRSPSG